MAQGDVGQYQQQLGQYAAENPYGAGGEFATDQNRILANTSDAMAKSAGSYLESQAARTGQNPAGAIGATEAIAQQNTRDLGAAEANADAQRIADAAGYNRSALAGYAAVPGMQEGIAKGEGDLYGTALGVQESAAKTPSFMDTLGSSFADQFGKMAAGSFSGAGAFG